MHGRRTLGLVLAGGVLLFAAAEESATTVADKAALAPLQVFIGGWKGVGQPKRGSAAGSWTEQADWAWQFADGRAA